MRSYFREALPKQTHIADKEVPDKLLTVVSPMRGNCFVVFFLQLPREKCLSLSQSITIFGHSVKETVTFVLRLHYVCSVCVDVDVCVYICM